MKNPFKVFTLEKRVKAKIKECEGKIIPFTTAVIVGLSTSEYIEAQKNNRIYENIIKTLKELL